MIYKIDLAYNSETTIYEAARRALDSGLVKPDDTIETWRDGRLTMSGTAGELAKRQVVFAAASPKPVTQTESTT